VGVRPNRSAISFVVAPAFAVLALIRANSWNSRSSNFTLLPEPDRAAGETRQARAPATLAATAADLTDLDTAICRAGPRRRSSGSVAAHP
jgi:hypothetical protein